MAILVDLEGDYHYKPSYTPPAPKPVASTQGASYAPPQGAVPSMSTPQPSAPAPDPNKWNSQYQMWEDPKTGSLWDSGSGAWIDPKAGKAWSQDNGWQSFGDYNQTQQNIATAFQEQGNISGIENAAHQPYSPQATPSKISLGDWTNFQNAVDYTPPNPRAAFVNYDLATSRNVPDPTELARAMAKGTQAPSEAQSLINNMPVRETNPNAPGYKPDARFKPDGGMLGLPFASQLAPVASAYQKYVGNPVAETLAQLTPIALSAAKYSPTFGGLSALASTVTGYNPDEHVAPGIKNLASAASNPSTFIDTQNKNLAARPEWQQLAATTAYDPLNLVGAGIGAKALETGLKGEGIMATLARLAANADKGIDVAQQKALGGLLKPIGKAVKPLASESGSVPAALAARGALAGGAGFAGYATAPDDASNQEKLLRALGFGAGAAVGPEVIGKTAEKLATGYGKAITTLGENTPLGKLGIGAEEGMAQPKWLINAPNSTSLDKADINPILLLKDVTEANTLPLRTKISNKFWTALSKLDKGEFYTHIDDARMRNIAQMHVINEERVPKVAAMLADEYKAELNAIPVDANGAVLLNGEHVPLLDSEFNPVLNANGEFIPAGFSDISEKKEWYLKNGAITPEQYQALEKLQEPINELQALADAFGFKPEPDFRIDPEAGKYFPRGPALSQVATDVPSNAPKMRKIGLDPGSTKARSLPSQGAGFEIGKKYLPPEDVFRTYAKEILEKANSLNTEQNMKKIAFDVELKTGKQTITLGDLHVRPEVVDSLAEQIKANRELRKDLQTLRKQKRSVDRDVRLATTWVDRNRNRVETLGKTLTDQSISSTAKAEVAHDALEVTRQGLKDAESAAREYAAATAKSAIKDSEARQVLKDVLDQASEVSRKLNALEDKITAAEFADLQQEMTGAWNYADTIRAAVASDASSLDAVMSKLAGTYGDTLEGSIAAREALRKVEGQFRDAITGFRQLAKEGQKLSAREATAASNVRAMISSGRIKELQRAIDQRATGLKNAVSRSEELGTEIDRLKMMLAPNMANTKELQKDIAATRNLARKVGEVYSPGHIGRQGWGMAGWEHVPMPREISNTWNNFVKVTGESGKASKIYDLMNDTFRMIGATLDASRSATVGLLNLADKPKLSIKGVGKGFETAFIDKEAGRLAIREIEQDGFKETGVKLSRAVGAGLDLTPAETTLHALADEGTLLGRIAESRPIKAAEDLYSVPANIERSQRFYDTLMAWKLAGKDYTSDRAVAMAANAANIVTGKAQHGFGAILAGDRASRRAFFAARFVQSQIESVSNSILVGGVEGDEARRAILKLAMGGAAITVGANELLGNKTDTDLFKDGRLNPNFMRIRIGDQDISVFGPWDSLMKGALATAQGDPGYFLRSKFAPVPGMVYDIAAGVNAIGQSIPRPSSKEFWSPNNLVRMAPFPFGLRDTAKTAMDTDFTDPASIGNLALSTTSSMLGVKSSPLSPREQYQRTASAEYTNYQPSIDYPKPSDPMDDPLFMTEYAASHPDKVPEATSKLGKELNETRKPIEEKMAANTSKFISGERNLGDWKETRKALKRDERVAVEHIVKQFNEITPEKDTPAYYMNEYFKTFDAADDGTGGLDYDKLDALQADFYDASPPWVRDYINSYFLAKTDPGPEREYISAMQQLNADGYFSGNDNSIPRYQNMVSGLSDQEIDDYNKIISDWQDRPKYASLKGQSRTVQAYAILKDYWAETGTPPDPKIVVDVGNSGKSAFESPEFKLYKFRHPELLAWFKTDDSYETIQQIIAAAGK